MKFNHENVLYHYFFKPASQILGKFFGHAGNVVWQQYVFQHYRL